MGRKWLRRIIVGVGILVVVSYAIGGALRHWIREERGADLRGTFPREGVATVVSVVSGGEQSAEPSTPWALVRYKGSIYSAQSASGANQLREGRQARIIYRVGHSGRIYVDRVEPLAVSSGGR